jgi:hypothetical protein
VYRIQLTRMKPTQGILIPLLLLVSVIALLPISMVVSQTTTITKTSYSRYSVTTTATSTNSIFYSAPFDLGKHQLYTCYYRYYKLDPTGLQGARIFGAVITNSTMDFYIMTQDQYLEFTQGSARSCRAIGTKFLVKELGITSAYQINWIVPSSSGSYYFIFANSYARDATVQFGLWTENPVTMQVATSKAVLSTEMQTRTPTQPTVATTSSAYYSTEQSLPDWTKSPIALAIIGLIVGIIIVVAIVAVPKHEKKTPATKRRRPSEIEQEKGFCINCGAELPPNSKFCNKCGTAQP